MNTTKQTYTYSILRFIPDIRTGEFLNVGIAIHSSSENSALIKCRDTFARITKLNSSVDGYGLLRILKTIKTEFRQIAASNNSEMQFESVESVLSICNAVLPKDDSSLQWSRARSGKCNSLNKELARLFERFVSYADDDTTQRKTEIDMWREFSRELQSRQFNSALEPHIIKTTDDQVEFQHSFKNGIWHCVQPISFDLAYSSNIKDKAHKWLGQMASVADSNEDFKVYFLIGEPADSHLFDSFENAKSILDKIPAAHQFYTESESSLLLDDLESVVVQH